MEFNIINPEYLTEISSSPTFIKKMADLFKTNIATFEVEMNDAIQKKDFLTLGEISHKAKSSVMIFGMKKQADDMKSLELDSKKSLKIDSYQKRVNDFIKSCKDAIIEINIFVNELE